MDEQTLAWLTILGSLGCFCGLFLLIAAVFVGGATWFLKAFSRTSEKADEALAQPAAEYLAETERQLLPWTSDALEDMSAYVRFSVKRGWHGMHGRGQVKSLRWPEATGWLAFDVQMRRAKGGLLRWEGSMALKSSRHTWTLHYATATRHTMPVEVDGVPLGTLYAREKAVELVDAAGRPVGLYHRPRLVVYRPNRRYRGSHMDPTPRFGPVEIQGRRVAEVNYNPIVWVIIRTSPSVKLPTDLHLIQNTAPALREEDELWLVALLGREILFGLMTRH